MRPSDVYFNRVALDYDRKSQKGLWRYLREKERRAVLALLTPFANERILEVGAGAGFYSSILRDSYNVNLSVVEASEGMIRELAVRGFRGTYGKFEDLNLGECFSKILCAGVLEFVQDADKFLFKCKQHLQPDGVLVLLVPSGGIRGEIYRAHHFVVGCPIYHRDSSHYVESAGQLGFRLVQQKNAGIFAHALKFVLN